MVLVRRLAHLLSDGQTRPENVLAITFTRRAAESVRRRLVQLVPGQGEKVDVMTMHSLGLKILQKNPSEAKLDHDFAVSDDAERLVLLVDELGLSERKAKIAIKKISTMKTRPDLQAGSEESYLLDRYEKLLAERNLVDFDDLITKSVALCDQNPQIAEYWRDRYRLISVDEAQDLDPMQEKLLVLLAGPEPNLCLIGDPDQSIYGFRGVRPGALHRMAQNWPQAVTIRPNNSYRSGGAIVTGALDMMNRGDGKRRQLRTIVQHAEFIGVHEAVTDKAEAEFIVHCIEQLIGGHSFFSIDSGRSTDGVEPDLGFGDMAVLYRTEKQSELFAEALERSGIPYRVFSHGRLMDLPAVRALAYSLREKPGSGEILRRLKARRKGILKANPEISAREMDFALELLTDLAIRCKEDTKAFIMELLLASRLQNFDPRSQRVSVMTIHSSKGLEFPVVFLTGCEDGLLPLRFGTKLASDMDEERRLFYVGMTRAMRKLILTRAKKRKLHGKVRRLPPSKFLLDVKKELIEQMQKNPPKRSKKRNQQLGLF